MQQIFFLLFIDLSIYRFIERQRFQFYRNLIIFHVGENANSFVSFDGRLWNNRRLRSMAVVKS